MEDLLLALLELLAEIVLELAGEALLDLMIRGLLGLAGKLFEVENPIASWFVYLGLGALTGWLSCFHSRIRLSDPQECMASAC